MKNYLTNPAPHKNRFKYSSRMGREIWMYGLKWGTISAQKLDTSWLEELCCISMFVSTHLSNKWNNNQNQIQRCCCKVSCLYLMNQKACPFLLYMRKLDINQTIDTMNKSVNIQLEKLVTLFGIYKNFQPIVRIYL